MNHQEAHDIIVAAWRQVHGREPTAKEALFAQAIALFETGYGRIGQFARMAEDGLYNWGALQRRQNADGSCPSGTAPGYDQGNVCFYVYPSDVDAAAAYLKLLTKSHWPVVEAMQGTAYDVAKAMRVPPAYYAGYSGSEEDRIQAYADGIESRANQIQAAIPDAFKDAGGGGNLLAWTLVLGAMGVAGWYYAKGHPTSALGKLVRS